MIYCRPLRPGNEETSGSLPSTSRKTAVGTRHDNRVAIKLVRVLGGVDRINAASTLTNLGHAIVAGRIVSSQGGSLYRRSIPTPATAPNTCGGCGIAQLPDPARDTESTRGIDNSRRFSGVWRNDAATVKFHQRGATLPNEIPLTGVFPSQCGYGRRALIRFRRVSPITS